MRAEYGAIKRKFQEYVAVGDGVHAVSRDNRIPRSGIDKPELRSRIQAVDWKCCSRYRAASQRRDVRALCAKIKTFDVSCEHLDPREYVVRHAHRLRPLKMRVSGYQNRLVVGSELQEALYCSPDFFTHLLAREFKEEPHVRRNLVVAAAGSVELCGGGNVAGEGLLDIHVDVFERLVPLKLSIVYLFKNFREP